jgi:protein required for attachment to host cells
MSADNWVVVADRNLCRVFSQASRHGALTELARFESERARLKDQDINADRPGRSFDRMGPGRHALAPNVTPTEQEAIRFAKEVAEHLEAARKQQKFNELYVIAEPRFLGHLRTAFTRPLREHLAAEIDKDLSDLDGDAIRERLRQATFGA